MSDEALQLRSLKRVQHASVRRILKDLVNTQPELIRDALIEGLNAPPPRSFPYLMMCASFLDGRPREAEPENPQVVNLSELSREELLARALAVAKRLQRDAGDHDAHSDSLAVIDVLPMADETPGQELARLTAEVAQAQAELDEANAAVERLKK